jgi:hypothetical protein
VVVDSEVAAAVRDTAAAALAAEAAADPELAFHR